MSQVHHASQEAIKRGKLVRVVKEGDLRPPGSPSWVQFPQFPVTKTCFCFDLLWQIKENIFFIKVYCNLYDNTGKFKLIYEHGTFFYIQTQLIFSKKMFRAHKYPHNMQHFQFLCSISGGIVERIQNTNITTLSEKYTISFGT